MSAVTDRALPDLLAALAAWTPPTGVPDTVWNAALVGPAGEMLARPGKDLRTRFVHAAWALAGGGPSEVPGALSRVIELLHTGSLIVDDVEDGAEARRGGLALHRIVGIPLAINTGSWMYFWALVELVQLGVPGALEAAVDTLARCHMGQALDLAARVDKIAMREVPALVAATTRLKTGALCRLATELAARAAGAPPPRIALLGAFGEQVGMALQMLDDLGAITSRRGKADEDLRGARPTWAWAWLAEQGDPFAWSRLVGDLAHVTRGEAEPAALAEALAERVAPIGRTRVRATLEAAVEALPATAERDAIAAELHRMEGLYGA